MEQLVEKLQEMSTQLSRSENGAETSQTPHSYKCPKCHGDGIYSWREGDIWYSKECPCGIRKKTILQNQLKFAEIPYTYKGFSLKDLNIKEYHDDISKKIFSQAGRIVKDWFENFEENKKNGRGLYLFSNTPGSGKTMAVCALANDIIKNYSNVSVKFSTSKEILDEITSTWGEKGNAEKKLIEDLSRAEILIIDDFGTETVKDWKNENFYSIINERYVTNRVTIFTSNLRISELEYDERIKDRILERSTQVQFPEESIRKHIAERQTEKMIQRIGGTK